MPKVSDHSAIQGLINPNIEIQVDKQDGKAHNKVVIIDNMHLITGSYNWTDEEYYNDLDVIVFIEDECVSKKFTQNYEALNQSYSNPNIKSTNPRIVWETYIGPFDCGSCTVPYLTNDLSKYKLC